MSFIKQAAIVVAGGGFLFIAGTARAQSVEVSVPFDFQVHGVTLPAGHYDLETDKSTVDMEATAAGTLAEIVHQTGDEVPVGEAIAYLDDGS